jgi:hypothetical protein
MVVAAHRKDRAKFHARIRGSGYNQVVLVMQVRLVDQHESEQSHHVTDSARARALAQQFAEEQGFDKVIWDDCERG